MWDLRWQPGVGEPLSHFPDLPSQTISNHLKQSHNLNHSTQSYLENHIDAAQTFCTKFE